MKFDLGRFCASQKIPTITPLVFALAAFIVGAIGAVALNNPHWINRSGALIAAFCALWVIYLIVVDIDLGDARPEATPESQSDFDPITDKARTLVQAQIARERSGAKRLRLKLALMNGVAGCIGEFVHGFGDLVYPAIAFISTLLDQTQAT